MARLGIVISGGDNCANKAIVHYISKYALEKTVFTEIYGARYGNGGLLNRHFVRITPEQINPDVTPSFEIGISREPIIFRSEKEFQDYRKSGKTVSFDSANTENEDRVRRVVENLKKEGISHLVYVGGEGTLLCAKSLSEKSNINILYVPSSMDCDVYTKTQFNSQQLGSSIEIPLTLGYSSAVEKIAKATNDIIPLAESQKRVLFIATMGGTRGHAACATACGGGQIAITPELIECYSKSEVRDITPSLCERIEHFLGSESKRDNPHCIVGVFEGTPIFIKGDGSREDSYGTPPGLGYNFYGKRITGAQAAYLNACRVHLKERSDVVPMATHNTDYTPKIGAPSDYDKTLAERMALKVICMLQEREYGCYPALTSVVPIDRLKEDALEHIIHTIRFKDISPEQVPVGVPTEFLDTKLFHVSNAYLEFAKIIMGKKKN